MRRMKITPRSPPQAPSFPFFFHILHAVERLYERASLHPQQSIYSSSDFQWTQDLEAHWSDIRAELNAVLPHRHLIPNFQDISPEQQAITQDDKWKTYVLYAYGARANHNCRECPRTTALVERIPGMKTAFFSILAAGKHIPAHRGPYKGLLRCHLALLVPKPTKACRIHVDGTEARWEEGKTLIFDDTLTHEVWNNSDGDRVVLFIDFSRPMRAPLSWINETIMRVIRWSPYARGAVRRFRQWYEKRGISADVSL
jgi:aspartyl/asparaginyl beta-hydroxylase (cupin superfamily)